MDVMQVQEHASSKNHSQHVFNSGGQSTNNLHLQEGYYVTDGHHVRQVQV